MGKLISVSLFFMSLFIAEACQTRAVVEIDAFEDELTYVEIHQLDYEQKIGLEEGDTDSLPQDAFMVSDEDINDPELYTGEESSYSFQLDDV